MQTIHLWSRDARTTIALLLTSVLVAPLIGGVSGQSAGDPIADAIELVGDVACTVPPVADQLCQPGAQAWVGRYDGTGASHDYVGGAAVSPDGTRVFVTGQSPGVTSGADFATVAYDTTLGIQLWSARLNGAGSGFDTARDVTVNEDGTRVFVTGTTRASSGTDYTTVAYEAASGSTIWTAHGDAGSSDSAESMTYANGLVIVTGSSSGDLLTIAYHADDGTEAWRARYQGPVNGYEGAKGIASTADGATVFVTGFSPGATSDLDYVTVTYDAATGAELWNARYDGPASGMDLPLFVGVDPNGASVYVTGLSAGIGTGVADFATIAYDAADGSVHWTARHDGSASGYDVAWMLAVAPDGGQVYVAGFTAGAGTSQDQTVVAYDTADGSVAWRADLANAGRDTANAVAVSPDGSTVYVTGESGGPPLGNDFATVAYNSADGTEAWQAIYDGPGTGDIGQAVVPGPLGLRVFVAGQSQGAAGSWDMAVVAYETGLA